MGDQNIAWRDDLDNLLACCGEAQWVEETDERLTALLAERDSLSLKLNRWIEAAKSSGYPCDNPKCFEEVCQLARGNYDYVAPPDETK